MRDVHTNFHENQQVGSNIMTGTDTNGMVSVSSGDAVLEVRSSSWNKWLRTICRYYVMLYILYRLTVSNSQELADVSLY
jgi:hypothetical protein